MIETCLHELVSEIECCIASHFSKDPNIKSVFVVGSMGAASYVCKKNNDLDLRIMVKSVSLQLMSEYAHTVEECAQIAAKYEPQIAFAHSEIIGPARFISPYADISLLLHGIILTEETFQNLPVMHRRSYGGMYRIICGEDCLKRCKGLKLSAKGILSDTEGLDYCTQHLQNREITYLAWALEDGAYHIRKYSKPMNLAEAYEFMRYSIYKNSSNVLDFSEQCGAWRLHEKIQELYSAQTLTAVSFDDFSIDVDGYFYCAIDVLRTVREELRQWMTECGAGLEQLQ